MSKKVKIVLSIFLFAFLLSQEKMCQHLGYGQGMNHKKQSKQKKVPLAIDKPIENKSKKNDSIYHWDDSMLTWTAIGVNENLDNILADKTLSEKPLTKANEVKWKVLMNIRYKLKYFKELDAEMYAPVFSDEIKKLNGKEVIIEGYVIPFDENGELLALSYNPYASCFFCGNASPASVISLYLKNKNKKYKADDFKKFKGKLYLNYNDPDNFYYILRNATEI